MRKLVNVLLILAAVSFLAGILSNFGGPLLLISAEGFWRGTTALLGFAAVLVLVQIRDKS
jgi:hypothetical protein